MINRHSIIYVPAKIIYFDLKDTPHSYYMTRNILNTEAVTYLDKPRQAANLE